MTKERPKFRRKKQILTPVHIFFMMVAMLGISAMYLNSGYGKGVRWIYEEACEDSPNFTTQLTSDVERIFTYIGYKDMSETDGELDMNKVIINYTNSPGETAEMTLDEIVGYIKKRDYYLNKNLELKGSPTSMDGKNDEEITVDFQSTNPNFMDVDTGGEWMTKKDLALDILNHLGEYYTIYDSYIEGETSLRFHIVHRDDSGKESVYTNVENMSLEDLEGARKYLYIPGNSIKMETNMPTVPENAATLLEIWSPNGDDNYYMVISVDTTYPCTDAYPMATWEYSGERRNFILGIGRIIVGVLGCIATLATLIPMSGHLMPESDEIRLFPIDEIYTKLYVAIWAVLTASFLPGGRYVDVRLLSLFMAEGQQSYWNKVVKAVIIYGCPVLFFFSVLHRHKVRILWSNSLLKGVIDTFREHVRHITFAARVRLYYPLFSGANIAILWGALFLLDYEGKRFGFRVLLYGLVVVLLAMDGYISHQMFKKAVQRGILDAAINSISQDNTRYQIEIDSLIGKERDMGKHLNNISSGLDSAFQQQVKSERLRADLITNVSYDIRTSLTSTINYVDLPKREKIQNPKIATYLEILDQKSQRLKTLTEDLVKVSKASPDNMRLGISDIDLVGLVQQINGGSEECFAMRHLELVYSVPDKVLIIQTNEHRLWRVLENLYTSAVKYTMEHSYVYTSVPKGDRKTVFTIKNVSEDPLNIKPDELTECFIRGNVAKTTEGSGLGLSIARGSTEPQNGQFQIIIDGNLFKTMVSFLAMHAKYKTERTGVDPASVGTAAAGETEQEKVRHGNVVADAEPVEVGGSSNHLQNEGGG